MISYKINDSFHTTPLDSVKLLGPIGAQMDAFLQNRLQSDFAQTEIFGEAIEPFVKRNDDETGVGYWRGEFWGKMAISAARTYKYTGDQKLKRFLIDNTHELLATQDADGYLNTYSNPDAIFPTDIEIGRRVTGWDCDFNWNIWNRKYTLWGLIEVYEVTGDPEILDGAVKLCDHLLAQLDRLGVHIMDTGVLFGLPTGSLLKPILLLYKITENQKYFDFCISLVEHWQRTEGMPNIITNALSGKSVHTWYPDSNEWAKGYEMLSCFDGLCELYRLTGENKYLESCKIFYDNVKEHEYNILHSVGFNDKFFHGSIRQNSLTEACDVIHWIRLASELYGFTGDVKYMHDIETAFYNPFLSASFEKIHRGARVVRSSGKNEVMPQMHLKYHDCCTDNMPRGYLNVAENFVTYSDNQVFVNFYTEFKAVLPSNITVEASGSYLKDGSVKLNINTQNAISLNLRIPTFSKSTKISVADKDYHPTDSGYCRIDIPAGKSEINIKFEWVPEIRDFAGEVVRFDTTDYRHHRYANVNRAYYAFDDGCMVWDRKSTLQYGPMLLTRSKKCGNTFDEMFNNNFTVCGKGYTCTLTPIAANEGVREQFKAVFTNGDHTFQTTVCDFATGSNKFMGDETYLFSIWF